MTEGGRLYSVGAEESNERRPWVPDRSAEDGGLLGSLTGTEALDRLVRALELVELVTDGSG